MKFEFHITFTCYKLFFLHFSKHLKCENQTSLAVQWLTLLFQCSKGLSSQSFGFSYSHVWMWELTIKKAECQRIDDLELWCWRRPLRLPWTVKAWILHIGYQIRSVAQSCPTLCDPMNRSTPGLPAHHKLPEFTQTHVHRLSDAIQPSHPLSSPSPPAPNPSQHQSLFQWVNSSNEVAKVLEFQL